MKVFSYILSLLTLLLTLFFISGCSSRHHGHYYDRGHYHNGYYHGHYYDREHYHNGYYHTHKCYGYGPDYNCNVW